MSVANKTVSVPSLPYDWAWLTRWTSMLVLFLFWDWATQKPA